MEIRQHIGILILLILIVYIVWFFDKGWKKGYKAHIPLSGGFIIWIIAEIFYLVVKWLII